MMRQLADFRKARNVTQEQLAKRLRISQERVSQIESGAETISVDRLLDFADALGIRLVVAEDPNATIHPVTKPKSA
jgi:transcriptional regulator with XRE-family HTH domain